MRRLLILRGGALGDFLVTLPALAALRARWPDAHIELVGNARAAQLALARRLLDAVHSQHEARWAALYSTAPLPPDLHAWLASFDLVLSYWPDRDGDLAGHFPCHTAQKFISAPAQPMLAPAAAHYCEPLRSLGLKIAAENYCYQFPRVGRVMDHPPYPRVAIHPGSGSLFKNWPVARWLELAAWLKQSHHAELLIITGDAEPSSTRQAFAALGHSAHNLPLEELVASLQTCRFFIGHDSGVSHLAAACGLPSLLLFGPTDPRVWAPPSPSVHVLRLGSTLAEIALSDVQTALFESGALNR